MTTLPAWVYIVAGVVGLALVGGVSYFVARAMHRAFIRRYIVKLFGGNEGIAAGRRTFDRVIRDLAGFSDDEILRFATECDHDDRRALADIRDSMKTLAYELNTMPLPKRLYALGEQLADVASLLESQVDRVDSSNRAEDVLEALAGLDAMQVARGHLAVSERLRETAERYDMEEAAVYGGGLYI